MGMIISPYAFGSGSGSALTSLFATSQGAAYDFTNTSQLRQNSDGTGTVTSAGDPIGYAIDQTGHGWNAFMATSSARPLVHSSNGVISAVFDGSNDNLAIPYSMLSGWTAGTIVYSSRRRSDPTRTGSRTGPPVGQIGSSATSDHYPIDTTPNNVYLGSFSTTSKTFDPTPTLAEWNVADVRSTASSWKFALDGTDIYTTATNTFAAGHGSSVYPLIGAHQVDRGDSGIYFEGRVGRVLIIDRVLSGADLTAARNWCAAVYAGDTSTGYRYYFLEVLTTGTGFVGASTIKLLNSGGTDYALSSVGATAYTVGYTNHGSYPPDNVNDGSDPSFTTSSASSAAGSGKGLMIDMMDRISGITKMGFRSRSDSFGAGEAILTGNIYAKVHASDSWTLLRSVTESGWSNNEYREWTL